MYPQKKYSSGRAFSVLFGIFFVLSYSVIHFVEEKNHFVASVAKSEVSPQYQLVFSGSLQVSSTEDSIEIRWPLAFSPSGIQSYEVWRDGIFLVATNAEAGGYLDLAVEPDKTYQYKVVAVTESGQKASLEKTSTVYTPRSISELIPSPNQSLKSSADYQVVQNYASSADLVFSIEKFIALRSSQNVFLDSDSDGISDYDEITLYHTDEETADSDRDGVPDASELFRHTDPNTASSSPTSFLSFSQKPTEVCASSSSFLTVDNIDVFDVRTDSQGKKIISQILFRGRGLANSFITVFLYSSPIVVTVKSDANGVWEYLLERELEDGSHEVYSTMTDGSGTVIARSERFTFVKSAEAITVGTQLYEEKNTPKPSIFYGIPMATIMIMLIAIVGGAVIFIGYFSRNHNITPIRNDTDW